MEIAAGFCPETASLLQRFLISGPDLRITAAPSSQQCGMARLQRSLRLRWSASDSILRCRKGERFRLLPSLRRGCSAADSNFRSGKEEWPPASHRRCGKEEWPAFRMTVADAAGDSLPRRRHNPKLKAAGVVTVPVGSRCHSCSVIFRRLPMSLLQRNLLSAPDVTLAA